MCLWYEYVVDILRYFYILLLLYTNSTIEFVSASRILFNNVNHSLVYDSSGVETTNVQKRMARNFIFSEWKKRTTLRTGLEPARAEPIGFQVQLLNHSDTAATVELTISDADEAHNTDYVVNTKISILNRRKHFCSRPKVIANLCYIFIRLV